MSSALPKLTNTIHIRDFVDNILPDRTRPDVGNYVEIHTDINIFPEDDFYDPDVNMEPLHACIRAYILSSKRELYVPDAFFYADGRFSTTVTQENKLEITVQALSLERHPGDVSDFDEYRSHLPQQWCPMVTVIGSVGSRKAEPAGQFSLRRFELQTSIYDSSEKKPVEFSLICFFSNGKRWQNFNVPNTGSYVIITAKLVGRVTTENRLAVRILDMTYLPSSALTPVSPPASTQVTPSKRRSRWSGRVDSDTPKKILIQRTPPREEPTTHSRDQTTLDIVSSPRTPNSELEQLTPTKSQYLKDASLESDHPVNDSPQLLASIPNQVEDRSTRPQRNRRPPKHYELDQKLKSSEQIP